jgi:adenylate cyclase
MAKGKAKAKAKVEPKAGAKPEAMAEPDAEAQRKLAAIAAVDVAGYSARALADQAASAAEIAALRARITAACADHGGRLFNAAGDGFMLEFPTASGAVCAAEELIGAPGPPLRIGVHLGDVQATPTGDLLGHGVNVAARIQALASPGAVLVSDDVRRAVRGALARRFIAHGAVRLDKGGEAIRVFSLGRADAASRARLAWRRYRLPLGVVAAALLAIAGAAGLWRSRAEKAIAAQARVAILPFAVQGGDALTQSAADGIADEMATVLSGAQFVSIAADQTAGLRGPDRLAALARLHAAFLLDGSVTHEGNVLRAHVRLDDARDGATVWSGSFTGPDSDPAALETDVASNTVGIAIFARWARLSPGGDLDAAVLATYLKASDLTLAGRAPGAIQARPLFLRVVEQAPGFSRGHAGLALVDGIASHAAPPEERDRLVREGQAEATTAMRLDAHSAEPYLAYSDTIPVRERARREGILLKGLSVEPDFPYLVDAWSAFLTNLGRTREAIDAAQRGLADNGLHVRSNYRYAVALTEAGQLDAARQQFEDTFRLRPAGWTDLGRLSFAMVYGTLPDAKARLANSLAHPFPDEPPAALAAWSAVLKARERGAAGDKAAASAALGKAVEQGGLRPEDVIPALCMLGDLDGAFTQLGVLEQKLEASNTNILFAPATAPMRRDPRFWAFAARAGLVGYWRATGHWPDVCLAPGALADCKARAAAAG